jgi:hypothetical protein
MCLGIAHGEPLVLVAETNVTYRGIVSNNIKPTFPKHQA